MTFFFFTFQGMCILVTQLCLTLCDPMDCSLPGSSVHGISQARIREWIAISFSRGSSWLRDQIQVSHIESLLFETPGKPIFQEMPYSKQKKQTKNQTKSNDNSVHRQPLVSGLKRPQYNCQTN